MDNKLFLKSKERAEQHIKLIDEIWNHCTKEQIREQILDQYVDYEYTIAQLNEELRDSVGRYRSQVERWWYYE